MERIMVIKGTDIDSFQRSILLDEIIEENEHESVSIDKNNEVNNDEEDDDITDNERFFIKTSNSIKSNHKSRKKMLDNNFNGYKDRTNRDTPLEVGIIDYCAVFGPASPFTIMQPSHYITSTGIIASLHNNKDNNKKIYSPDNNSTTRNLSSNNNDVRTLLRSDNNNGNVYGLFCDSEDEQEIIMWDRLPRHNHLYIELPSKIEWFACPEGSKTVLYPKRPNPFFQSFVLSSGGETEEIFGLSINFFIALYNSKYNSGTILSSPTGMSSIDDEDSIHREYISPNNNNNNEHDEIPWWRRIRYMNIDTDLQTTHENNSIFLNETENNNKEQQQQQQPQQDDKEALTLWTAVSFCVLFRSSNHVQQLRKCLELGYFESILPNLTQWEDNWKETYEQEVGNERNNELNFQIIKPFSLYMEKLIATLCLECPIPIPGFLKVSIKLKVGKESLQDKLVLASKVDGKRGGRIGKNSSHSSCSDDSFLCRDPIHESSILTPYLNEQHHNMHVDTIKEIEFHAPLSEDFPRCPYGIEVLLKCFGPRVLIDIVCCVLSESRMLFHSADLSLLPVICEGLRTLIYPLQWSHVYLPVLPKQLLSVVEAPVPFMLGTHTKWLKHIQIEYMQDMVLIDCDTASIDMGGSTALKFSTQEDRWLMMALKTILQPILLNDDIYELSHPFIWQEKEHDDDNDDDVIEESQSPLKSIIGFDTTNIDHHITDPATQIQLVFYDILFHLLRYVPDCFISSNPTNPVFNLSLFMSDYASVEYKPTLEIITLTSCFHVLTESIHSPSLAFFYENIVRLKNIEKEFQIYDVKDSTQEVLSDSTLGLETLAFTEGLISPPLVIRSNSNKNKLSTKSHSNETSTNNDLFGRLNQQHSSNISSTLGSDESQSPAATTTTNYLQSNNEDLSSNILHTDKKSVRHVFISELIETNEDMIDNSLYSYNKPQYFTEYINEDAYSGLFPIWILKHISVPPEKEYFYGLHNNSNNNNNESEMKVESIRRLLEKRLEYYQPYLKHRDKNKHRLLNNNNNHNLNNSISQHESILRHDSINQENNLLNETIEIENSNIQHHLIVPTDYAIDLEMSLKNTTTSTTMIETETKEESKLYKHLIKQNIIKDDSKVLNIIKHDIEQLKMNHYLIAFNNEFISIAQQQIKRWTLANLAEELHIPIDTMILIYNRNHTNASNKLEENTQFAARRRSIKHVNKLNEKEILEELEVNEFESK